MTTNSNLLENNRTISFTPGLATAIGVNEAIVLSRIHFWLGTDSGKVVDGVRWIYNSAEAWQQDHFPFWHVDTVRRTFSRLEESGILLSRSDLNQTPYDRTKWHTISQSWLSRDMQDAEIRTMQVAEIKSGKEPRPIPEETQEEEKNGSEKVEPVSTTSTASTPTEPEAVSVAAEILPLPVPGHDTDAFRQKWAEWQAYRREKKAALKPTTAHKQLAMLMKYPEQVAIAMLEQSMLNGWQGIFELKNNRPDPPKPRPWTPLGYNEPEQPRANGAARPWTPLGG